MIVGRYPCLLILAAILVLSAVDAHAATSESAAADEFPVPPPPFKTPEIFPCSDCHADMDVNYERRELVDFHEDIDLDHGPRERWCFDCHNPEDRDWLRLAGGELVPFTESYRLCGQCHGDKYRDWRVGVHGKRTGRWDGEKRYLLCAHCHDPHKPHFAPIAPMPAPTPPSLVRHEPRGAEQNDVQRQPEEP